MQNKSYLSTALSIAALIALLALAGYVSRDPAPAATSGNAAHEPSLVADQASYNLGVISMKDGLAHYDYTVTNASDATTTIASVITSCMCTTAYILEPDGELQGPFGMEAWVIALLRAMCSHRVPPRPCALFMIPMPTGRRVSGTSSAP